MKLTRNRILAVALAVIGLVGLFLTAVPGISYATTDYLNVTSTYTPAPPAPFDVLDVKINILDYSKVDTVKVSLNSGPEEEITMPDPNWIYHWIRSGLNLGSDKVTIRGYSGVNLVETRNYLVNSTGGLTVQVDTNLSGITLSSGSLSPVFSPSILSYSVFLPSGTTNSPTVAASTSDPGATNSIVQATSLTGTLAERTATILVTAGTTQKTYTVVFSIPTSDLAGTAGDGQVSFTFSAPTGATSVKIQQKAGTGTYTDSTTTQTLDQSSTTAVVTGLTNGTAYTFKLVALGGIKAGESNEVTIIPASLGFTVSGRILLEGDNLQSTGTYYSGDVVVELKQGADVKYSVNSSTEQNLTNNGKFMISNVVPGSYTVVLSKRGYVKRTFAITINNNTLLTTSSTTFSNRLYLMAGDIVQDQYEVIGPADIGYMLSKYKTDRTKGTIFDESVDLYKDQYDVVGPADIGIILKNYKFDSTKYSNDIVQN